MLDLRLVSSFLHAARTGSFSEAGRSLHLSPAGVSQNIKTLESQLGVRLFTRTTRQVRLTPEGQRFMARVGPALAALDDAVRAVSDESERIEGQIRISATTWFGRTRLVPLLTRFMAEHPKVEVEVDLSDRFVDLVAEAFDLAIRIGSLPENEYVARLLLPLTPLLCAAPSYLAAHGAPERIEDLARHRCIAMRSNTERRVFNWEFSDDGETVRHLPNASLILNEAEAVAIAAEEGFGLAQVGSQLVEPRVAQGKLQLLMKAFTPKPRGVYAVYPTRRYTPQRTKALIAFLAKHLAGTTLPAHPA